MAEGNTEWKPTLADLKLIEELGGLGLSMRNISARFNYSETQFKAYIRTNPEVELALERGRSIKNQNVAQALYDSATGNDPSVSAIIWWEKTRAEMAETTKHELSGPGGGPIVEKVIPDAKFVSSVLLEIEKAHQLRHTDDNESEI